MRPTPIPTPLREEVQRTKPALTHEGYPKELKLRVGAYAHKQRQRGCSWKQIAKAVGLSHATVAIWARQSQPDGTLLPVVMTPNTASAQPAPSHSPTQPSLVSPTGFRLEGLTVDHAVALFRTL